MTTKWTVGCLMNFLVLVPAKADEKGQSGGDREVVRKVDLKDLTLPSPNVNSKPQPYEITSAEELAKAFTDEAARTALGKKVDFSKDKLIFFLWNGAPDSTVDYKFEKAAKGSKVVFAYDHGFSMRLEDHHLLFIVPRPVKTEMGEK